MKIFLGHPGPSFIFGAMRGSMMASQNHYVNRQNSAGVTGNFDILLCDALNEAEAGECTHKAVTHGDVSPEPGWLDVLVEEAEKYDLGLVSVPIAIKDFRGLLSCGIGDPEDNWHPLRRTTVKELEDLPDTFNAEDLGYPGYPLLHNTALFLMDLRKPEWFQTDEDGNLVASFSFPRRCRRDPETGKWVTEGESEDWYFSRMAHNLGIRSAITKRVKVTHRGPNEFPNWGAWGQNAHDEDLRYKWDKHESNGHAKKGVTCGG